MEMEAEGAGAGAGQMLPEYLVEKILAMVPFPYVFKARGLSKSWKARFASISSLEDDDRSEQLLALNFQKFLTESSSTWKTLCPVCIDKGNAFGYDRASDKWRRMPSLSFLPKKFLNRKNLEMEGPLLYALPRHDMIHMPGESQLYVANVLSRSWKQIPVFPEEGFGDVFCQKLVIDQPTQTYKVIRFCRPHGVHIYDSKLGTWSSNQELHIPLEFHRTEAAYLNGILYIVSNPNDLVAYNVEKGTVQVFHCAALELNRRPRFFEKLMVCNGNLMLLLRLGGGYPIHMVLKVALGSEEEWAVATGPPDTLDALHFGFFPVSDGKCIFFGIARDGRQIRVLAYDLDKDEWSCPPVPAFPVVESSGKIYNTRSRAKALKLGVQLGVQKWTEYNWIASCFQPSLSPFLAV